MHEPDLGWTPPPPPPPGSPPEVVHAYGDQMCAELLDRITAQARRLVARNGDGSTARGVMFVQVLAHMDRGAMAAAVTGYAMRAVIEEKLREVVADGPDKS
jgi:hypothetical protein